MSEIITLLACLNPVLNYVLIRQLACIAEAMLAMSGHVTMLGLHQRTSEGGSYRTIQRFFNTKFNWPSIRWLFVRRHLQDKDDVILVGGDDVTVTKSGKKTYGIGRFFSSLYGKKVPGTNFLCLSLISVINRRSFPITMEQVTPELTSKDSETKSKPKTKKAKKGKPPGRAKGSKNKNRKEVELSKYLLFVQATLKSLLNLVNGNISLLYFVFDGALGNNGALQMVRQCNLHLISKMRYDSALYLPYTGKYSGRGPHKK